jgi:hypothetical protein
MVHGQNSKAVIALIPVSVATNATATGIIDTIGFDYCVVDTILDTAATNPAKLLLAETDDTSATAASSFTAIATFTGDDTTNGFTIPAADTSNAQIVRMAVDCRKRKRRLQLQVTSGVAQLTAAHATLTRAATVGDTTTEMGLTAFKAG